jgi:hypothetical protein
MQRIKYLRPPGVNAKPAKLAMQCKQFVTNGMAPSPAKPKLWGFHRAANAAPSLCVVTNARGDLLRVVK